jgi:hypothetical protein
MKRSVLSLAVLATLAACGSDSTKKNGFPQPANTVALSFSIDDTAAKTYTTSGSTTDPQAGTLQWKGSFTYDYTTRMMTFAADWAGGNGPYAQLYDDGPWDEGGHEPLGSVAADHKWGVTAFMTVPTTAIQLGYGAMDEFGWIWPNGGNTLDVPANSSAPLTATGMSIAAPTGTVDLKLALDTSQLAAGTTYTAGDPVKVKGTFGSWGYAPMTASGTTNTMTLSDNVGAGKTFPHVGLLKSGDQVQFVFGLGPGTPIEYKCSGKQCYVGATAQYKAAGGSWTSLTITACGTDNNPCVTIP